MTPQSPATVPFQTGPLEGDTHCILLEEVEDHVGQPGVAPMSVDQQQLLQVLETREGEVAGHDSLAEEEGKEEVSGEKTCLISTHTHTHTLLGTQTFTTLTPVVGA